jgi:hypothetical protein
MLKYFVALAVFFLLGAYGLYFLLFYVWLTATPLPPGQLPVAQHRTELWFATFCAVALGTVAVVARMIYIRIKRSLGER